MNTTAFCKTELENGTVDEIRPEGQVSAGVYPWQLGTAAGGYRALFEEAERRGLELIGYAYEEGITEISLLVQKNT